MDIDLNILRALEREKEISFAVLVEAIEQALHTAYLRTPGAQTQARVELDRKTGHVTVFAAELDDEGTKVGEFDDTPDGFGRIAATTAKQIMLQRLRDAEDDIKFGEFSGKEGDIISGVIQQGRNPDDVMVDLGRLEALLPTGERVPGEDYSHGTRIPRTTPTRRASSASPARSSRLMERNGCTTIASRLPRLRVRQAPTTSAPASTAPGDPSAVHSALRCAAPGTRTSRSRPCSSGSDGGSSRTASPGRTARSASNWSAGSSAARPSTRPRRGRPASPGGPRSGWCP